MNKLALMSRDRKSEGKGAPVKGDATPHYQAFLSYSHTDSADADWLHKAIERFSVPNGLVGQVTANGTVPRSLSPIFRDRHELAASSDLGQTIRLALKQSRFLIVLCSPAAAQSRWVNEEILTFKKLHGDRRVLAAIVGGEPWASEMAGREEEECFPPALRQKYDRRGHATGERAEPIAADLREDRDGREAGKLKLVAGMLGLGLDDLVQREQQRRQKRLTYVAAASLAGMTVASGLAVFAFDKRDEARDQRREAEGLVGFMLGDLREQLEPIGKLDALNAVGARALAYFEKQDKAELSDAALAQRSRALSLLGEISNSTDKLDEAVARYREAMAGTQELVRREPHDPQRLFDHAQNIYWIGEIARGQGRIAESDKAFSEYKSLADRMVAAEPGNPKWQMEVNYAAANLGIVRLTSRRFADAEIEFRQSLAAIEALLQLDDQNNDYRASLAETLAWLADSRLAQGKIAQAIADRRRQIATLQAMITQGDQNVALIQKSVPAQQALAVLYLASGRSAAAIEPAAAAVNFAEQLIAIEPKNARWKDFAVGAFLVQTDVLLKSGDMSASRTALGRGCAIADLLFAKDASAMNWRSKRRDCEIARAKFALTTGDAAGAISHARAAASAARGVASGDPVKDGFSLARANRLLGDAYRKNGKLVEARIAWKVAGSAIGRRTTEQPWEMSERAKIMRRLGDHSEVQRLDSKLREIGYSD